MSIRASDIIREFESERIRLYKEYPPHWVELYFGDSAIGLHIKSSAIGLRIKVERMGRHVILEKNIKIPEFFKGML